MCVDSSLESEILYALYQLDPAEFENFIGEVWQRKGWKTDVTQPYNDNGVDIIAKRDNLFLQKHLIQTKRFGPNHYLAKHTINKYSNLKQTDENIDAVIIITTSRFTERARQRASELNIKLVNGSDLASVIIETNSIDIVERYSEENISYEIKQNNEKYEKVDNRPQSKAQSEQLHQSAESDIPRSIKGLEWIKQKQEEPTNKYLNKKRNIVLKDGIWSYRDPICSDCGEKANKNGTRERRPKGSCFAHPKPEGSIRIQSYRCTSCNNGFYASPPFVEDGYRYIDDLREMVKITYAVSGLSMPMLQLICLFQFDVMPSKQRIDEWRTISTKEIITNDIPSDVYSGYYTYDEQVLELRNQKAYRLLLYDVYRHIPVAEQIVESAEKDVIQKFLKTVIDGKPCKAVTTDGRPGMRDIIDNKINTGHYRCQFHLIENFQESIDRRLDTTRPPSSELVTTAIIGSKFKQIFEMESYNSAIQRLEWIKKHSDFLPKYIYKYIDKVDEYRNKFLGGLKNPRIPRTIKSCERYFSNTQSSIINEKSFKIDAMQSFLRRQMALRTVREGLIPDDLSIRIIQENFDSIEESVVKEMYTEKKSQYLFGEALRDDC